MANIIVRAARFIQSKIDPRWQDLGFYSDIPQAVRMSKNFKTFVKSGYKDSDTLYKCVSYIIRNGAAIPPVLYTDDSKQKRIDHHDLLDLLNKPNIEQSGVAYREAALGYKLIAGNAFQYAIRKNKMGPPAELWTLRPDKVEIKIAKNRGIVGYQYETMDDPILPMNIGHTKYWNPDDDDMPGFGLSPVEAAALNIDMQVNAKKWNLSLLQNNARPPGIWKIATLMARNERQKLEDKLNEKFSGAKGAGKSPLFDGGVDWKPTGLAPAQMDFLDSLKYNGGSIANILNIAPQLIGDTSSTTFDNMEQAKIFSYTEAIFPELDDLYAMWNAWLVPMFPDLKASKAYLYYDKETVEVIQQLIQAQKDAQANRAKELWMDGLCLQNEARELAGLPPTDEGDVYRIGDVLIPKGKLQEYAEQSLTEPAAPPAPIAEPVSLHLPPPPAEPSDQQQQEQQQPPKYRRFQKAKVNYKVWHCASDACSFCLENDGIMVGIDEDFPNGCATPDDCHKFCKCEAHELAIPDALDLEGISLTALIASYSVRFLVSRHDKDMQEQREKEQRDDEDDIDEDTSKVARHPKTSKDLYRELYVPRRATLVLPKRHAHGSPQRSRKTSKQEYRQFMEETLR